MRVYTSSKQAIPVRPEIVRLLGRDFVAAIYYQQLVFYAGREPIDAEGYFTKSASAIERDTALTRRMQDRAREKLMSRGWLAVIQAFDGQRFKPLREQF